MEKTIQTLAVGDVVALELENYGYCYHVPKPSNIGIGEHILVTNRSFPEPYVARFVKLHDNLILIA